MAIPASGSIVGTQALLIAPARSLSWGADTSDDEDSGFQTLASGGQIGGQLVAEVTIEEVHNDDSDITDHPIESAQYISDHVYFLPPELTLRLGWSDTDPPTGTQGDASTLSGNSSGQSSDIYNQILQLRAAATLFTIVTGKRQYSSMLIKSIGVVTDYKSEHALFVMLHLKQINIASTSTVSVPAPAEAQAQPNNTQPIQPQGTQPVQVNPPTFQQPAFTTIPLGPQGAGSVPTG